MFKTRPGYPEGARMVLADGWYPFNTVRTLGMPLARGRFASLAIVTGVPSHGTPVSVARSVALWRKAKPTLLSALVFFQLSALPLYANEKVSADNAEPVYKDELISGGDASGTTAQQEEDAGPQPEGLRSTVLEFRSYTRKLDTGNAYTESGFFGQYRHETLNWGDLFVEGAWRSAADVPGQADGAGDSSARLTLRQIGAPLPGNWSLSNSLGIYRTSPLEPFGSSFRFNLPGVTLNGVASYLGNSHRRLSVEHGHFVQMEGLQGLGTRRLDGKTTGATWSERINDQWSFRAQALSVDSQLDSGSYQAVTGSVSYANAQGLRAKAQFVSNGQGRHGEWLEGEWQSGFHSSRASLWNFTPSLYWYNALLSNGQHGVALRHDYADPGRFWGLGLEHTSNHAFDSIRAGTDTMMLSANGGTRLDRRRSVGFNATWRETKPQFDDGVSSAYRYAALNLYGSRAADDVSDRLQLSLVDTTGSLNTSVQEVTWTRDIVHADEGSYGFTLGVAREQNESRTRLRPAAGVSAMRRFDQSGFVSAWLRYARDSDQFSTNSSLSSTVQAQWSATKHWTVLVSGSLNRLAFDQQQPLFGTQPTRLQERALWFSLRWSENRGVPYGGEQGSRGAGVVRGMVYYDENRDGVRQSNERPAGSVVVWINGMQSATTGPDGRFEFPIVATGKHTLRVEPASVRLPWSVDEDKPWRVVVEPRGITVQDIPLFKLAD